MIELQKNNEITFKKILVISDTGEQLGVMVPKEGIKLAFEKNLDLVCVAPNTAIPVCKFMNYGKYKFETIKKEKANKKNQHVVETSEIQMSYTIQENDMLIKAKTCKRLIEEKGNMVRVVLRLKGREVTMLDLAKEKVKKFIEMCSGFAKVKKDIFIEGRDIKIILEKKGEK